MMKKTIAILCSLVCAMFLTLTLTTTHASAKKNLSTIPASLRGSWYLNDREHGKAHYVFTKKYIYTHMQGYARYRSRITPVYKLSPKTHWAFFQKFKNGWYSFSYTEANGFTPLKKIHVKINGHRYVALAMTEIAGTGIIGKRARFSLAFHKPTKKPHTRVLSTKGWLK